MLRYRLLKQLADLNYHSGNVLARQLACSRTAVWKAIRQLREAGIDIQSRHGKGYRLLTAMDLLDEAELAQNLCRTPASIELYAELDSTNSYLLARLHRESIHAHVVLCEYQRSGRGRRSRPWLSPFAAGLYLSIGWHFAAPPASLNALSLACGVALIRALQQAGADAIYLKWPNDVIANDAKLAGILIESRSETATSSDVVIGIGVNINLDDAIREKIDQPVIDLASIVDSPVLRNRIAADIIDAQFVMLEQVSRQGANSFIRSWREFDYLTDKKISLHTGNGIISGVVQGVDSNGLLVMNIDGTRQRFSSGEVSLQASP